MLAQPLRARMLTFSIVVVAGALLLWLVIGSYARTETARGILATKVGSAKMIAPHPGQVTDLLVEEGEHVVAVAISCSSAVGPSPPAMQAISSPLSSLISSILAAARQIPS